MVDESKIRNMLALGENVGIEFKRAGDGPKSDTYETICAFLNHTGGDIILGVSDKGEVLGLPEKSVDDMMRSIVKITNDPNIFRPTLAVWPEHVVFEGKHLILVHVPESPEVHWFKGECYERVHEADVVARGAAHIAQLFIRKQHIFTEQRVYPLVTKDDLRLDLLPRVRNMTRARNGNHPWLSMSDDELLASAQLTGRDYETGRDGFKAAAVLLLGKDQVIGSLFPAYKTDALLRRVNVERYDDRDTVSTNLIESWERLLAFGQKHLNDKFFINEEGLRVSLRDSILREVISNMLIHREFTSAKPGRLIIEKDRLVADNANKAYNYGIITLKNLKPEPKNPIIAKFFNNICRADELGSGVRNLYRDVRRYSAADPIFDEGDVFTLTVPLNDSIPAAGQETSSVVRGAIPQVTTAVSPQYPSSNPPSDPPSREGLSAAVKRTIRALKDEELGNNELLAVLQLKDRADLRIRYLTPALEAGLIERTQANVHAPNQKYRLTESGRRLLDAL